MDRNVIYGGAAGSAFGPGNVYIMKNEDQYKIGCSNDPDRRLGEIQRQPGYANTELVDFYRANEMNRAETEAQRAAMGIGLVKAEQNATDWFNNPHGVTESQCKGAVRNAVASHNKKK